MWSAVGKGIAHVFVTRGKREWGGGSPIVMWNVGHWWVNRHLRFLRKLHWLSVGVVVSYLTKSEVHGGFGWALWLLIPQCYLCFEQYDIYPYLIHLRGQVRDKMQSVTTCNHWSCVEIFFWVRIGFPKAVTSISPVLKTWSITINNIRLLSSFSCTTCVFLIREDINWKKKVSFGHRPNYGGGGSTHARIFWPSF